MRLSDAEWRVMNALWEHAPTSARDLLERLDDGTAWAYSTVKTLLARLAEKSAVAVEMRGNTSFFTPLVSRADARRSALRSLVDRAFDGTVGSLLHHLVDVERLSADEREQLRNMLAEDARDPAPRSAAKDASPSTQARSRRRAAGKQGGKRPGGAR